MTPRGTKEQLLRDYALYDTTSDIVSAFEALFTQQPEMSTNVVHFERFPKVPGTNGSNKTPDFTVMFADGHGLVGEVKNLTRHRQGLDDDCAQLGDYSCLSTLPTAKGKHAPVTHVDLLIFVTSGDQNSAVDRLLKERILNPDHPCTACTVPVIIGHNRTPNRYEFVRNRDPLNGTISEALLHEYLDRGFNAKNDFWTPVKIQRRLVNDPVPPLYMATMLWTDVLPAQFGDDTGKGFTAGEVQKAITRQYGRGSVKDVQAACDLLVAGGYLQAPTDKPGIYVTLRRRAGKAEFHADLAERATRTKGRRAGQRATAEPIETDQQSLF